MLYSSATAGPESKTVSVRVGAKQIGNIRSPQYEQVDKYTDEEIRTGKSRNRAARLAILEHFMKFAEEGSEYEQCELVDVVMRLWGPKSHEKRPDDIPVESLLEDVAQDETRSPAVRVAAMTRLPSDKRTGERELMLTVLRSPLTSDEQRDHRVVRQAIEYLKQHDPDALKAIHADAHWKRVMINEAAGLPPAPRETVPDDEISIHL